MPAVRDLTFQLERFEWVAGGRLELAGRPRLFRAVESHGDTVDFYLLETRSRHVTS